MNRGRVSHVTRVMRFLIILLMTSGCAAEAADERPTDVPSFCTEHPEDQYACKQGGRPYDCMAQYRDIQTELNKDNSLGRCTTRETIGSTSGLVLIRYCCP